MKNWIVIVLIAIFSLLSVSCKEEESIGCESKKFECAQFDMGADGGVAIARAENGFEYWQMCEVIVYQKLENGSIQPVEKYSQGAGTFGENEKIIIFGLAPGLIEDITVNQAAN